MRTKQLAQQGAERAGAWRVQRDVWRPKEGKNAVPTLPHPPKPQLTKYTAPKLP